MLKLIFWQLVAHLMEATSSPLDLSSVPSVSLSGLRALARSINSSEQEQDLSLFTDGRRSPLVDTVAPDEAQLYLHLKADDKTHVSSELPTHKRSLTTRASVELPCKQSTIGVASRTTNNLSVSESPKKCTSVEKRESGNESGVTDHEISVIQTSGGQQSAILKEYSLPNSVAQLGKSPVVEDFKVVMDFLKDNVRDGMPRHMTFLPAERFLSGRVVWENSMRNTSPTRHSSSGDQFFEQPTLSETDLATGKLAVPERESLSGSASQGHARMEEQFVPNSTGEGKFAVEKRKLWSEFGPPTAYVTALHNAFLLRTTEEGREVQRAADVEARQWIKELKEGFWKDLLYGTAYRYDNAAPENASKAF